MQGYKQFFNQQNDLKTINKKKEFQNEEKYFFSNFRTAVEYASKKSRLLVQSKLPHLQ
jgi:hypothetical protein